MVREPEELDVQVELDLNHLASLTDHELDKIITIYQQEIVKIRKRDGSHYTLKEFKDLVKRYQTWKGKALSVSGKLIAFMEKSDDMEATITLPSGQKITYGRHEIEGMLGALQGKLNGQKEFSKPLSKYFERVRETIEAIHSQPAETHGTHTVEPTYLWHELVKISANPPQFPKLSKPSLATASYNLEYLTNEEWINALQILAEFDVFLYKYHKAKYPNFWTPSYIKKFKLKFSGDRQRLVSNAMSLLFVWTEKVKNQLIQIKKLSKDREVKELCDNALHFCKKDFSLSPLVADIKEIIKRTTPSQDTDFWQLLSDTLKVAPKVPVRLIRPNLQEISKRLIDLTSKHWTDTTRVLTKLSVFLVEHLQLAPPFDWDEAYISKVAASFSNIEQQELVLKGLLLLHGWTKSMDEAFIAASENTPENIKELANAGERLCTTEKYNTDFIISTARNIVELIETNLNQQGSQEWNYLEQFVERRPLLPPEFFPEENDERAGVLQTFHEHFQQLFEFSQLAIVLSSVVHEISRDGFNMKLTDNHYLEEFEHDLKDVALPANKKEVLRSAAYYAHSFSVELREQTSALLHWNDLVLDNSPAPIEKETYDNATLVNSKAMAPITDYNTWYEVSTLLRNVITDIKHELDKEIAEPTPRVETKTFFGKLVDTVTGHTPIELTEDEKKELQEGIERITPSLDIEFHEPYVPSKSSTVIEDLGFISKRIKEYLFRREVRGFLLVFKVNFLGGVFLHEKLPITQEGFSADRLVISDEDKQIVERVNRKYLEFVEKLKRQVKILKDIAPNERLKEACDKVLEDKENLIQNHTSNLLNELDKTIASLQASPQTEIQERLIEVLIELGKRGLTEKADSYINQVKTGDQDKIYSILRTAIRAIDPKGTSTPVDQELWDEVWRIHELIKRETGIELIYPKPGTNAKNNKETDTSKLIKSYTIAKNCVISIDNIGTKQNGKVIRKAKVVVSK